MMTDAEFKHLMQMLFRLGLNDGDNGYAYWMSVINELKEMRKVYVTHSATTKLEHGN